eukprot:919386-Prorocentrum_minimum.AAC.1
MDQSDAVHAGIFSRWANQMQYTRVYSHDGPIRCSAHGYILRTTPPSRPKSPGPLPDMICA